MDYKVIHLSDKKQFGIDLGDEWAIVEYVIKDNTFDIVHTLVPKSHSGQGIASQLVEAAFGYAKEQGYRLQGSCTYAEKWLMRHPEFLM